MAAEAAELSQQTDTETHRERSRTMQQKEEKRERKIRSRLHQQQREEAAAKMRRRTRGSGDRSSRKGGRDMRERIIMRSNNGEMRKEEEGKGDTGNRVSRKKEHEDDESQRMAASPECKIPESMHETSSDTHTIPSPAAVRGMHRLSRHMIADA
jgi:hypothetical protein